MREMDIPEALRKLLKIESDGFEGAYGRPGLAMSQVPHCSIQISRPVRRRIFRISK